MKQKLGYKWFFSPSVYDPLNLRLRISNTQAIFSNACTCYLVIQLITLQLKLDFLGGKIFSYILNIGKRYFCGWEKLI